MPVEQHEIHERVRVGADFRYGCHNKQKRIVGMYWSNVAKQHVPSRMSTDCRFDLSLTDPACDGCKHRGSGEAYSERVRTLGK